MALSLFSLTSLSNMAKLQPITSNRSSKTVKCTVFADRITARRATNYHPPISKYDNLRSLTSNSGGETHMRRANRLKEDVRMMLEKVEEPLYKLELIDTVQRLGISYHFEVEIKKILESIYNGNYKSSMGKTKDLYVKALEFRLLREHGFQISQEVFNDFKDEFGNLKAYLCEDIKGMLYLYEASYLSFPGESIMDEARYFTTKHLKQMNLQNKNISENNDILVLVDHALEHPMHWRMLRMKARWFIEVYERKQDMNSTLLELAKLDFNMVQAVHQEELNHLSSWWKSTGLGEKLSFARDRLMENFVWTVGMNFKPEFRSCREIMTKVICLITIIDDIYDEHGTLQELELFTGAIVRWEINAIEKLPNYLKICFLALYNSINEMTNETLKEQDFCTSSYLKDAWANLCKCYLQEAKWYHSGYTPTLEEYMKTAWISVGGPLTLVHAYFSVTNPIRKDDLEYLENYTHVIRWPSLITRISNDLGISQDGLKKVDNPKSIQCYMHETGASMTDARNHMKYLIEEAWKNINEYRVADSQFNQAFIETSVNLARTGQHMYQHGDGHGMEDTYTIILLLIEPVPLF